MRASEGQRPNAAVTEAKTASKAGNMVGEARHDNDSDGSGRLFAGSSARAATQKQ